MSIANQLNVSSMNIWDKLGQLVRNLSLKSVIEHYTILILIIIYIIGYSHAAAYDKIGVEFFAYKKPFQFRIEKFDADYSINIVDDMPLAIVPFDAPFPFDESLYIKQIICFFPLRNVLVVFVRTGENNLKVITLKKSKIIDDFKKSFEYRVLEPKDFFNDTLYFPNNYNYYDIRCLSPKGDVFVYYWPFIGNSILLIVLLWFILKIFKLKKCLFFILGKN